MTKMWMVRSNTGEFFEDFHEKSIVAVGFSGYGKITAGEDGMNIIERRTANGIPDTPSERSGMWQLWRFVNAVQVGDSVVTYSPQLRRYLVGEITSEWRYDPSVLGKEMANVRDVRWLGELQRDSLSTSTRNTLGSTLTIFLISEERAAEVLAHLTDPSATPAPEVPPDELDESELLRDIESRAVEFIKDRLNTLGWEQMQELVAGILRAMGYKTRVSPSGPDRGKDIIASPDGFGFENPRIVVEVKHRKGAMRASDIRSFLGGRHSDDRGLYVSTGGFSKEAYYEAERATIPVTLLSLDDLTRALIENYEKLDVETKQLVPLRRIYWPT